MLGMRQSSAMDNLNSMEVSLTLPAPSRVESQVLFRIEEVDPFVFSPLPSLRALAQIDVSVKNYPHEPPYSFVSEDVFQMLSNGSHEATRLCDFVLPRHNLQVCQDGVTAVAFGGTRVESFVRDQGRRCWSVSKSIASKLVTSGLTGVALSPITFVAVEGQLPVVPEVFGLLFRGAPCDRIGTISGPKVCTRCDRRAVFCERCGYRFLQCSHCGLRFQWTVLDAAVDESTQFRVEDGIPYQSEHILDGGRYDGADFVATATHFFISNRAVAWLSEEGVRGFAIRPCLLAY
jgi:hypothetical protein